MCPHEIHGADIPLLKASGLIRSARGPRGGYMLAKEPCEISLHDIVQAPEGSWALVDCLDDDTLCDRTKERVTYEIWDDVQAAIHKILDSTTLADMIERPNVTIIGLFQLYPEGMLTSFKSSPRYSRSFGPNTPRDRQISVHRWTTGKLSPEWWDRSWIWLWQLWQGAMQ